MKFKHTWQWVRIAGLVLFLVAAAFLFVTRGVLRARHSYLSDFAAPYAGSRALLVGENPYADLDAHLLAAGAPSGQHTAAVYPPATFVALLPFALWRVPWAKFLFILTGLGGYAWASLLCLKRARLRGLVRWLFVGVSLAFAPLHTGLFTANLALVASGLTVIALLSDRGHPRLACGIGTIALILKPQLGIAYLGYLLLRRRWRASLWLLGAYTGVTILVLALHAGESVQWIHMLRTNLKEVSSMGSIAPWSEEGYQRGDLGILVWTITHSKIISRVLPVLLALGLYGAGVLNCPAKSARDDGNMGDILCIAVAVLACLAAGYHRLYDFILLLPLCAFQLGQPALFTRIRGWSWIMIPAWLFPGAAFFRTVQEYSLVPRVLTQNWLYNVIVVPAQVWVLLVLCVLVAHSLLRREPAR